MLVKASRAAFLIILRAAFARRKAGSAGDSRVMLDERVMLEIAPRSYRLREASDL